MTVYESVNATSPRDRLQRVVKRNGDVLGNSAALMATSVMTSLLGVVYWWVAARSFPAHAVGVASAAISAMTLVSTLGMFGMGTLLISELPRAKDGQWSLISTCVTFAAAASTVGGVIYVSLALFVIPGLRESLHSPLGACLLIVATCLNGATLVLDQGLVGLLAGHLQLLRNAYFAVGKLVFICVLAALPVAGTGTLVLATWIGGMVLSLLLIFVQLRSRRAGASIRPRPSAIRGLARQAMDHNLLNVSLFLPRICLPLVVAAVISTRATAVFYTAWMVISFLSMIPGSIATTLFAVASGDMAALRAKVRVGLVIAMGFGVPMSLGIALFAGRIMSVFGKDYVDAAGALSILALTYAPGVIRQFYVTISRVRRRTRQASFFAVAVGVLELTAAWEGGRRGGLLGLATWLAITIIGEGVILAPLVLRVVLARVAPAPPAAEGAGTKAGSKVAAPSAAGGKRKSRLAARHVRSKRPLGDLTGPPKAPHRQPTRPAVDETAIIPLRTQDATVVFSRPRFDDPAVMSPRDAETTVFDRPVLDGTVTMPKVMDDPADRLAAGGPTVDTHAATTVFPRITADILSLRGAHEKPAAGEQPTHGGYL